MGKRAVYPMLRRRTKYVKYLMYLMKIQVASFPQTARMRELGRKHPPNRAVQLFVLAAEQPQVQVRLGQQLAQDHPTPSNAHCVLSGNYNTTSRTAAQFVRSEAVSGPPVAVY